MFDKLEKLGVRAFVNLMDEFGHLLQQGEIQRRGMTELYIPTPDYLEPRIEDIERAVQFLELNANNNVITYIHCKAGKGRAPTIALCYLMKKHQFTPHEAMNYIVARRGQVSKHLHTRPAVLEYHGKLQRMRQQSTIAQKQK